MKGNYNNIKEYETFKYNTNNIVKTNLIFIYNNTEIYQPEKKFFLRI